MMQELTAIILLAAILILILLPLILLRVKNTAFEQGEKQGAAKELKRQNSVNESEWLNS